MAVLTLDQLAAQLDAMAAPQAVDFTPLQQPLAVLCSASIKENFAGGHDPDGTPWLPLKRPRANSKGGDKPLRDRGLLMASATGNGAGHVERWDGQTFVFGSNLIYAGVHQRGATISKPERRREKPWVWKVGGLTVFSRRIRPHSITIPARPFAGVNQKLADDAGRIAGEFVARRYKIT